MPADEEATAQEVCLLKQPYIRDESLSVEQLLQREGGITVRRFARFEVGN